MAATRTRRGADIEKTMPKNAMGPFSLLRDWLNAACLMLTLSVNACAVSPAPQITAPPPGQARPDRPAAPAPP